MLRVLSQTTKWMPRRLTHTANPTTTVSVPEKVANANISVELYNDLKARVHGSGKIEKIVVTAVLFDGSKKECLVNRHLSTPLTCAKHLSKNLADNLGLAVVTYPSGAIEVVSPNSVFTQPCEVEFISLSTQDQMKAQLVNNATLRSASVLLASVVSEIIPGAEIILEDHQSTMFAVSASGSSLNLSVGGQELLEKRVQALKKADVKFETINVPESVASEYGFSTTVNLCKFNDYASVVDGPVLTSSSSLQRVSVFGAQVQDGRLSVRGVAIPASVHLTQYQWDLIRQNAQKNFKP